MYTQTAKFSILGIVFLQTVSAFGFKDHCVAEQVFLTPHSRKQYGSINLAITGFLTAVSHFHLLHL